MTTCRDAPLGPAGSEPAFLAVAPALPAGVSSAAFGIVLDSLRVVVVRPETDTLADQAVEFNTDSALVRLALRLNLQARVETLLVTVELSGAGIPLFSGTAPVEVIAGPPGSTPVPQIPLGFIGPGAGITNIAVAPPDTFLTLGDSLRFQVNADSLGAPVTLFYVAWSTSDPLVAIVNAAGVLRAPLLRSSVQVIAATPAGVADTTTVGFQPLASELVAITMGLLSGTLGTLLATPLEVEVRAADGVGVGGVPVRFRPLTAGGLVTDTLVYSDAAGRASTSVTLGTVLGAYLFEASAPGLTGSPLTFTVNGIAGVASQMVVVAGGAQTAVVNTPVPAPPAVALRDQFGNPVPSLPVDFAVASGGGSVTGGTPITDAAGIAAVGGWTLGTFAGPNALSATAGSLTQSFAATGVADAAAQLLLHVGDLQTAVVNTAVAVPPAVKIVDQYGNPVAGAAVGFAVGVGGGVLSGANPTTGPNGIATAGSWTLGIVADTNTLIATAPGLAGSPLTFRAAAVAAAPSQILKTVGDLQIDTVNQALPVAPTVRLLDTFGNPVSGDTVAFAVLTGGGFVASPVAVTDATGAATAGAWTLATIRGPNTLQASVTGVTPVTFSATGVADAPFQIALEAGDGQASLLGQLVAIPPAVRVRDQYLNPVAGSSVTFTITDLLGDGLLNPTLPVSTDTAGIAAVNWRLATVPGTNTLEASVPGLVGSPVSFTAQGLASTASQMAVNAGDAQTGVVGTTLPTAYAVRVNDALGLPVAGVPVSWSVTSGGGSITPAQSTSDINGIATATRVLGLTAGPQTATASVSGLTGSPVTFSATALADVPAQVLVAAGNAQSAAVGTPVPTAPAVRVADVHSNPVAGVAVTFAVSGGGGLVTGATTTTDPLGLATVGGWQLGNLAGPNTLTATAGGIATPANFTATGVAGAPTKLAFVTEPSRALAGDTIVPAVLVAIQDAFGNVALPAKDPVTLRLGANPSAGTLLGTLSVAAVNGVATFPELAVDSAGIGYTIMASAAGLTGSESQPFDVGGVVGAVFDIAQGPVAVAANPATPLAYVAAATAVSVIDESLREVARPAGFESAVDVAVNGATNLVFVSNGGTGALAVIDGTTHQVLPGIPVGSQPTGVAVDELGNRVFIAVALDLVRGKPALVPVDPLTLELIIADVVELPAPGSGIAFNPNDGFVYVAIPALQEVAVVDVTPGAARLVAEIRPVGEAPHRVAVDPRSNLVFVTNRDERTVSVIDAGAREEIARIAVGAVPEGLDAHSDLGLVFVANSGENTVSVIDAVKHTVLATLVVGPNPRDAAVDKATGRVWVATWGDSAVRVIQP